MSSRFVIVMRAGDANIEPIYKDLNDLWLKQPKSLPTGNTRAPKSRSLKRMHKCMLRVKVLHSSGKLRTTLRWASSISSPLEISGDKSRDYKKRRQTRSHTTAVKLRRNTCENEHETATTYSNLVHLLVLGLVGG